MRNDFSELFLSFKPFRLDTSKVPGFFNRDFFFSLPKCYMFCVNQKFAYYCEEIIFQIFLTTLSQNNF